MGADRAPPRRDGGTRPHGAPLRGALRREGGESLRSTDPTEAPIVERGFLSRRDDLATITEAIELARTIAATPPLAELLGAELRPGDTEPTEYVEAIARNYFHPAGTCPLGEVIDTDCGVLGTDGLFVVDASIMPTIPRANTNLTTAAIAERVASSFGSSSGP